MNEKSLQVLAQDANFIVRIFSSFQDHVHLFIVQEYLPGGDLFNFLREFGVNCSLT
jgi:serine/threonine protein kinase